MLLSTGDKLVFDYNHNNVADGGEPVLVQVTGGQALALLDDIDGDGHFDPNELVGLAVSDGFAATIKGDVSGTIVTSLSGGLLSYTGTKLNLLNASIASLTVTGNVGDSILAGGSVANLKLGKSIYGASSDESVNRILTGTAVNGDDYDFGGGPSIETNDFTPATGAAGGSISNVTLASGAREVRAGDGGANTGGAGGAGGSVVNLSSTGGFGVNEIVGGDGGSSTGGAGGEGGSVTKVKQKTALHANSP